VQRLAWGVRVTQLDGILLRVLALIQPPPPSKDFPGKSLQKFKESNNQHKLQDSPPIWDEPSSQNNIGYFFHFLSALMVSGESCNKVNYTPRSICAETGLGSEDESVLTLQIGS